MVTKLQSKAQLSVSTQCCRRELKVESDSELDLGPDDTHSEVRCALPFTDQYKMGDRMDLHELYFSNEEYYRKLEQLRRAQLCTMVGLKLMYLKKPELRRNAPLSNYDRTYQLQSHRSHHTPGGKLKKAYSAHELGSSYMDDDRAERVKQNFTKDLSSPKERVRNMWQGFHVDKISSIKQQPFSAWITNYPSDHQATVKPNAMAGIPKPKKGKRSKEEGWRPRVTVPKPFQMTLRETEHKRKALRSRCEIERENEELRREQEELTECQRKFRATPMPAHVRLPLYEELRERDEERRRQARAAEQQRLLATQRPFSFVEREHIKKQQKELQMLLAIKKQEDNERRPFRAKPVPRYIKEAALGERQKEEQLYREIKKEMRATDMLLSATEPPSVLAKRLSERRAKREDQSADGTNHKNRFNPHVPDFDARYRCFQKQLESKRECRTLTTCEPFKLCTSSLNSCKGHLTANPEVERKSQSTFRNLCVSNSPRTPLSSLCSSLSGSFEYLPSKITDAAKKRQEAVRKVLEQRKKADQEEKKWKERQRQKERKLQKLIARRAQANDPHVALAQIYESKLKEFRRQDLQRRREYQEEMREIQERVKSRPLLLERVTQMNARKAAEKRYTETLHAFGLSEDFNRKDQNSDHQEDAVLNDYLPFNYSADYDVDEQDIEDALVDAKIKRQHDDEGEDLSEEGDPSEDGDGNQIYEDDLDFDDHEDHDGDESEEGSGERSNSCHSNRSSVSDDGKRDISPVTDEGRTEDGKQTHGNQEAVSAEETKGREGGKEKNDDAED
ncbi:protein FAM161B [Clarias gariepinus]